jgi:hypothetical protein
MVTPADSLSVGAHPKDIPFTAADGRRSSLSEVREPYALVAFAEPPAEMCCAVNPNLIALASRYRGLPVTVAQVSLPTKPCPHGPGCVEACNLDTKRLIALCDSQRLAWAAYGKPTPGTVFLIDEGGAILQTGTLGKLAAVADRAYELGQKHAERHRRGPDDTY